MVGGGNGRVASTKERERETGWVREGAWKGALRAIEWERIAEVRDEKGVVRRKGNEKDGGTRRIREGGGGGLCREG